MSYNAGTIKIWQWFFNKSKPVITVYKRSTANKDIISIIKYNEPVIKIQIWAASSDYMCLIDVCNVKKINKWQIWYEITLKCVWGAGRESVTHVCYCQCVIAEKLSEGKYLHTLTTCLYAHFRSKIDCYNTKLH